jgi:hypothetical protein
MNNVDAMTYIDSCNDELSKIKNIIDSLGHTSNVVPYLTKYAIIKSCGTIELSFKTILSDYCSNNQSQQVKNYIDKTLRDSSMNPSYDNICNLLNNFDENWKANFKSKVGNLANPEKIKASLQSLNVSRNNFAHGGNPTTSFQSVVEYFNDSIEIIKLLDTIFQ